MISKSLRFAPLALAFASGCVGVPTPLAPGVSGAVGVPHQGVQTSAAELPVTGKGFTRFRPRSDRYFGHPRLIAGLVRVAAELDARFPGSSPLVVGDLSARHGGKISGHNSHRTGRDVDLLFFYKTPAGAHVRAPGFIHVESDGLALVAGTSDYLRFDVEKTWELVKLLVEDSELRVQFIFASRVLESLLVDYALARGERLDLVYRAQAVLLEPGDSLNHDDHFHVRIACSPEDEVAGCSGGGPVWEWLPGGPPPFELTHDELHAISADDPLVLEDGAPGLATSGGS
jgi:penicillin-insensitive murein endopeptidase